MFVFCVRAVLRPAVIVVLMALAGCAAGAAPVHDGGAGNPRAPRVERPNIVFVLTDDLTSDLISYMPNVRRLQRDGRTFTDYFVTDSFCCPSRASIFTGQFPHNTHVYVNGGRNGGFAGFTRNGKDRQTFATALHAGGYRTAMMGKYLNEYGRKTTYVPPGWDDWQVSDSGYGGFDYVINDNGKLKTYGHADSDYFTDVLSGKADRFINRSADERKPFMLEVAPFAPHVPSTPAPRDAHRFENVRAPRGPAFNPVDMTAKPCWLRNYRKLGRAQFDKIDKEYVRRVQSVQAVDRMVGRLRATLQKRGLTNTYFVFSSDNGYHMGQYRLMPGKLTAYDTDIKVPLIVAGPSVPKGSRTAALAENVDLAPTFEDLAGVRIPPTVDGRSLVPALLGRRDPGAPAAILVEHHGPSREKKDDPDRPGPATGNPPSYTAIRTAHELYVRYNTGDREYHDLRTDPHELTSTWATLPPAREAYLQRLLSALKKCRGHTACTAAGKTT